MFMRFQGFRLSEGQIQDVEYIASETGMSKSQMVRHGLQLVINDYFAKEKIKIDQMEKNKIKNAVRRSSDWLKLPDEW
jgi:CRISPR/Cas system-associated protein Cas7 (RAMP superfamily)